MNSNTDVVRPAVIESRPGYATRWTAMLFIGISLMVITIDNTILNVALPSISRSLSASASELEWIVDSYVLVFASLLLTMGALGDKIGRKRSLQMGLIVFGLASLGSAFSTTTTSLILTRAFMGIGGALIMPATLSIINATFPPEERARAIAIWATIFGLGAGIGPLTGGVLLRFFSWQSIFLVNIPVVIVALIGGRSFIAESKDDHAPAFDLPGVLLSITGLFALVFGIISAGESGWTAPQVLSTFAAALVLLTIFVIWERRTPNAMLPLRFFANPAFTLANTALILMTFSLFGLLFMLTQYFQSVLGYEPLLAGIVQLPVVVIFMIVTTQSAKIVARLGTKRTVAGGALLVGIALLYYHFTLDANTTYPIILIGQIIFAIGFGMTTSPATSSVMQSVPVRKSGIGSAMNDMTRQVGGALGVAVLGSILNGVYRENLMPVVQTLPQLTEPMRETILRSIQGAHLVASQLADGAQRIIDTSQLGFVAGMQQALLLAALVMLVSAVLNFLWLPDVVTRTTDVD
ncbi:MAG: MFS transporter [Chloroflexota bacterium]